MTDLNTHKIDINVTTQYLHKQSDHENYVFAYTIAITNVGTVAAKLMRRHWIITDANGNEQEVRGAGVIGEQPHLQPGESFEYTSNAILKTPVGSMRGDYQMLSDDGSQFYADIPIFSLAAPNALN